MSILFLFNIHFVSFFCSLSLLSGQIRKRENMHSTSYLKASKSSICRTSSKTGILQDCYISPPPVSTQTVYFRIYYSAVVDLRGVTHRGGTVPFACSCLLHTLRSATAVQCACTATFFLRNHLQVVITLTWVTF